MFVVNSALCYDPPFYTTSVYFLTETSLLTLANPFASSNGIEPPAALSPISPDFLPAYIQNWNLNVEREVPLPVRVTLFRALSGRLTATFL